MSRPSHPGIYDTIGGGYATQRTPDLRIAARIMAAPGDARTICNIGAGAGSYEPHNRQVIAVEPSHAMIVQRRSPHPVVRAVAEALPFCDAAFEAALTVLSVHHWEDIPAGLAEMRRIAPRRVVFTFDPERQSGLWLVRDYVPAIAALERERALTIDAIVHELGSCRVEAVPIPWDCTDGFQSAYWRRPERYLDAQVRASISSLAQLPPVEVETGMRRLAADLASGAWAARNAALLAHHEMDYGYRLIVSTE